ncbi:5-(carboxyamino)imidazole ribonucleotide synthase [Candidatus Methylospira mobilis]|nr:5-(carboxyamino)imidazole ribonucleotide synthase [Candidatus Methylospira mobilis]WNV04096.1 5-(carboxyamino)imidazole ribonucleotide synthase [Candidatus Methylospira mobilis]
MALMLPIVPDAMLGMLGGGQLGRMFTLSARSMGYRVTVLDPDEDSPAGALADVHIRAAYDDSVALRSLAETCAAVTTEFENVPGETLRFLEEQVRVAPSSACVSIAQDRIIEKRYINQAGLQTAPFLVVDSVADLDQDLSFYLPGILKIARLGYDGKGQIGVNSVAEVRAAFAQMQSKPCVLERKLDLQTEISVILTRVGSQHSVCFPVAENRHADGILDISIAPARINASIAGTAKAMAQKLAEAMDYIGVLAVEFFVLSDDTLVINEIAPRPHNSGHYTLNATLSSQFDQQVRALCGLTPASTRLLSPVVMVNLLGDIWQAKAPPWAQLLNADNVHLQLYGKKSARPGRKMGHFNVLSEDIDAALQQALRLKSLLLEP